MGLAIAKRFAQEGADVVICDVDGDALESAVRVFGVAGLPLVGALSANVASRAEVRSAVECAAAGSGQLDILVAQAGIAALGPFLEVEDATWHRIVDVNLNGLFYSVQEGARRMPAGGSVVVTSSTNASYVEAHTVPYSTSKGAAVTFVRATALDLAVHGIRINAICPGISAHASQRCSPRIRSQVPSTSRPSRWGAGASQMTSPTRHCFSRRPSRRT